MLLQRILSAALLIPALGLSGTTALAGDYSVHDGDHPVFLQYEHGEYRYPERAWAEGGISCVGGGWIVYHRGFYNVNPIDCEGRTFIYSGSRWDGVFKIHVDSRSGYVRGVSPG
jgi:hypothetical protein